MSDFPFGTRASVRAYLTFSYDEEGSVFAEPSERAGLTTKRCSRNSFGEPRIGIILAERRKAIGWHKAGRAPANRWDDDVYSASFTSCRYITVYEIRFPDDYTSYWVLPEDIEEEKRS